MKLYSEEDLEAYIQYTYKLWNMIQSQYSLSTPKLVSSDPLEQYANAIASAMTQIQGQVFVNMLEPFASWMRHDCSLTGHKTPFASEDPTDTDRVVTEADYFKSRKAPAPNK